MRITIQVRPSQIRLLQRRPKHESSFSILEAAPLNNLPYLVSVPVKQNNKRLAKGTIETRCYFDFKASDQK